MQNLQPLGAAAKSVQLTLAGQDAKPVTQVTLFDQGIVQVLQAAVTGLSPKQPYVLALSDDPKGTGHLEALAGFIIARGTPAPIGEPVQVEVQP
jgi:hypothetical protein